EALNESTVRGLKKAYLCELGKKKRAREELIVSELKPAKRGRPFLLGESIDNKIQQYLTKLRECGSVVSTAITIAGAKGIVLKIDKTQLVENGGHLNLTRAWAKFLLTRMGFVKCRITTKASKRTVEDFNKIKAQFLLSIRTMVQMENIHPEMIFNWDQTGQ
uniref:Uncharacterized protein n=1 Tax=Amphimedon queenslandica TaxID=400682 RepID=A0A1X7V510_AMPQE